MFGKASFFITLILLGSFQCIAQINVLEEKRPEIIDGIEYGYFIKKRTAKNRKGRRV